MRRSYNLSVIEWLGLEPYRRNQVLLRLVLFSPLFLTSPGAGPGAVPGPKLGTGWGAG